MRSRFIASVGAAALIMVLALAGCGSDNSSHKTRPTPSPSPTPAINAALWVANSFKIVEFVSSQLVVQGISTPVPQITILAHALGAPRGVAFDAIGNLWVIMGPNATEGGPIPPSLEEFTSADLSARPVLGPNVTIRLTGFTTPVQGVFDTKGDLWISGRGNNEVFEYTSTQLAVSGSIVIPNLAPNLELTANPAFAAPIGVAFDAAGGLWVANNGTSTIFEFKAGSLSTAGSTTLTPDVILSDDGNGSIQAPWGLAFDSAGNLWSSNSGAPFTLVEFAPSVLVTGGGPVPIVTISPNRVAGFPTLNAPGGIAFDNLGDLAAGNLSSPFGISLFSAAQIGTSDAPIPDAFLAPDPFPNISVFPNVPDADPADGMVFGRFIDPTAPGGDGR